jgi:hypothetical protein
VGSLGARKDGARNVRADIHLQLVHDSFFRFDVEIELMNLMGASEAI